METQTLVLLSRSRWTPVSVGPVSVHFSKYSRVLIAAKPAGGFCGVFFGETGWSNP